MSKGAGHTHTRTLSRTHTHIHTHTQTHTHTKRAVHTWRTETVCTYVATPRLIILIVKHEEGTVQLPHVLRDGQTLPNSFLRGTGWRSLYFATSQSQPVQLNSLEICTESLYLLRDVFCCVTHALVPVQQCRGLVTSSRIPRNICCYETRSSVQQSCSMLSAITSSVGYICLHHNPCDSFSSVVVCLASSHIFHQMEPSKARHVLTCNLQKLLTSTVCGVET